MLKKFFKSLEVSLVLVILLISTDAVNAKDSQVSVTLPHFNVTVNGHTVDNKNNEYPLLVYRDITYFPMTWYNCRFWASNQHGHN